jgi:ABC-2 type transport system ATP-binding protein
MEGEPIPFAIDTTGLCKVFGNQVAVQDLTLQVRQGEVFGFLGPNGAGKTTSIKMLLGLIEPTAGQARLLGVPLTDKARFKRLRGRVGFLPEHFRFYEWLTGNEFLAFHGELYDMPPDRLRRRSADLLEQVGLGPFGDQQLRTYSKGMLQRIGLAQALLNQPELVFLDEPTSGLDPVGRRLVRDIIHELRQADTCVFLNSHLLSEIEVTCDRVAFIKHGEVLRVASLAELSAHSASLTIRAGGLNEVTLAGLARWGHDLHSDGETVTLALEGELVIPEITAYLVAQGAQVYAITPQRLSLEDLFIQIVGTDGGL